MANDYPVLTPLRKSDIDKQANRDAKLNALADAIDAIEVLDDGSLYVKTKSHLIIESAGNQVLYSDGDIVIKSKLLHLNPVTPINGSHSGDEYVARVREDTDDIDTTKAVDCGCSKPNEETFDE